MRIYEEKLAIIDSSPIIGNPLLLDINLVKEAVVRDCLIMLRESIW